MSLLNYLPAVQGSRVNLGVDAGFEESFILAPGLNDYVVGGYQITPTMVNAAGRLICDAYVTLSNAAAGGFIINIETQLAQLQSPIVGPGGPGQGLPWDQTYGFGVTGYSAIFFKVFSGNKVELPVNYNLFQCGWILRVRTV